MANAIKSIKRRRFCKLAKCKRLLSMYNVSEFCHVHQQLALSAENNYSNAPVKSVRESVNR